MLGTPSVVAEYMLDPLLFTGNFAAPRSDSVLIYGAKTGLSFARKLHQAVEDSTASNQEQAAGVRGAELSAAAAARAQQDHVQQEAAESQWDPLGFRQVVLLQ